MDKPLTQNISPDGTPADLTQYEKTGGYSALRQVLKNQSPADLIDVIKDSNLRGRGGGGFSTGMKWSFMPAPDKAPFPRYLVVNADEMEPGTFKDRLLMENDPHSVLEGVIVSSYILQVNVAYIFLRWAYQVSAERMRQAIEEAYARGYLGKNIIGSGFDLDVYLHVSVGRYICGEETALLNALEGKRARPRSKPPYPASVGLWGRPTVVNNVETISNVPHIIRNGADWFRKLSQTDDGGTKLYGVSGRVRNPGLWELPMGTTIRELIEVFAGGMQDGHRFRAVLPGGASTQFIGEDQIDTPMDFATMPKQINARMGTGTMIVIDDKTCPVQAMLNLQQFFAQESCGWCTPCRDGLPRVAETLNAIEQGTGQEADLDILRSHAQLLGPGHTYCALAPGASESLSSGLRLFDNELRQHIHDRHCPWS